MILTMALFGVLPMVTLANLPMVPLVANVLITVTLKCEINLISRNQIDFAKSDLTEMRNQTKFYFLRQISEQTDFLITIC